MPAKKAAKSKSQSVSARGRSKSVGRSTPKSRSRTPSRSRSRSRVATVSKRARTPASESKIRRRRSPSSSSSSSERSSRPTAARARAPGGGGDKRGRPSAIREATPTRVSQRIIHKLETTRQPSVVLRSLSPTARKQDTYRAENFLQRICSFFQEKICPPSVQAFLAIVSILPLVYWFNFFVFTPASSLPAKDSKVPHTLWGPAYRFAGVLWPIDWRIYLDYRCHSFVLLYLFIHFLIARFIPLGFPGSSSNEARRSNYKANGWFAFALSIVVYGLIQFGKFTELSGVRPSLLIPKYWLGLLAASGNIGTLLAIIAFVASRRLPRSQCSANGNTGNVLVDFWVGRSVRPRWLGLDWKMVMRRPSVIGLLLLEVTCLCTQWERYARISPALFLLVALRFIWFADTVLVEHKFLTTFEVRSEGFGYYEIIGSLLFPFLYGLTAAHLIARPDVGHLFTPNGAPIYAHWAMHAFAVILFLVGYWIYRSSNNQKYLFRIQPNHPSFTDTTKISGPNTQRLFAGGWWGFVRHPNYLGNLMMAYAASLPSGFTSPIPWIYPLFLTVFLSLRAARTERINAEKYGMTWTMYMKLVPYKLIPRIY